LLTLLATPIAYTLFDDLSSFIRRVFRLKTRPSTETGADEIREDDELHEGTAPQGVASARVEVIS
jgi:hypothetical protein